MIKFSSKKSLRPHFFRKKISTPLNFFDKKSSPPVDGLGPGTPRILTWRVYALASKLSYLNKNVIARIIISLITSVHTKSNVNNISKLFTFLSRFEGIEARHI